MLNTKMYFPTSESLFYNTKVSCHMGMGKITDRKNKYYLFCSVLSIRDNYYCYRKNLLSGFLCLQHSPNFG